MALDAADYQRAEEDLIFFFSLLHELRQLQRRHLRAARIEQ